MALYYDSFDLLLRMHTKKWKRRISAVKIPLPQSSSWRPSVYQEARGLWVRDCKLECDNTGNEFTVTL